MFIRKREFEALKREVEELRREHQAREADYYVFVERLAISVPVKRAVEALYDHLGLVCVARPMPVSQYCAVKPDDPNAKRDELPTKSAA